jgi:hypothetical protein
LERIILEITPVRKVDLRKGPSKWTPQGYYNPGASKSSTGDLDAENLWAAAADDYSFFSEGNEDEATAFLDDEQQLSRAASPTPDGSRSSGIPDIDLVEALGAFRQRKSQEYTQMVRNQQTQRSNKADWWECPLPGPTSRGPVIVEGHWKGRISVVRNPTPGGQKSGVADAYGNFFERGYLYD